MQKKSSVALTIVFVLLGLLAIVGGGLDDSPGGQGIGLVIIAFVLYKYFKKK